jgi:tetratricopeptide (TPR) repeat protein
VRWASEAQGAAKHDAGGGRRPREERRLRADRDSRSSCALRSKHLVLFHLDVFLRPRRALGSALAFFCFESPEYAQRKRSMATVRVSDEVQAQLDEYICIQRAAIDEATTRSGSNFEALVKDLAELFHRKYQATGDLRYLDESVSTLRVLLDLRPAGHLDRMSSLRNLSVALRISHARAPDADKVEEAAVYLRELLNASPPGDPARGVCLSHLAPVLYARSQHSQSPSDLEELVAVNQEWLTYCPPGHPVRDDALDSLASALHRSFKQGGHTSLLTESIQAYRQALLLRPPGHVSRDESLTGLGLALLASDARGDPGALDEASVYLQEVLELRPPDHPSRASALSNVASALESQFQRDGNKAHLARAIALNREALELRPPGHPSRHAALNHLAMVLSSGSEDSETRDEAIRLLRLALDSCPVGTETRFVYMNNLAATLREVYEHRGHVPTLLESMELQREALKLSPPGHPSRDISLAHVAVGLEEMFKAGHHACLEESITLHREALELRPLGHPQRSASLTRLAGVLRLRFEQGRLPGDLTEAVILYREALLLRPQGHPSRFESLFSLGICLLTAGTPVFDFHGALAHISEGITDDAGPALQRVRKAVECVNELNSRVYANWATITAGFDLDIRHRMHLQVLNMIYSAAKLIP